VALDYCLALNPREAFTEFIRPRFPHSKNSQGISGPKSRNQVRVVVEMLFQCCP
jgi:hypothetical protein